MKSKNFCFWAVICLQCLNLTKTCNFLSLALSIIGCAMEKNNHLILNCIKCKLISPIATHFFKKSEYFTEFINIFVYLPREKLILPKKYSSAFLVFLVQRSYSRDCRVGRTAPEFRSALCSLLLRPFGIGSVTVFDLALLRASAG